jgi:hypothetical protein
VTDIVPIPTNTRAACAEAMAKAAGEEPWWVLGLLAFGLHAVILQ